MKPQEQNKCEGMDDELISAMEEVDNEEQNEEPEEEVIFDM